jgi:AAA ATPase domain
VVGLGIGRQAWLIRIRRNMLEEATTLGGDGWMTQLMLGSFVSYAGNDLFVGREPACQLLDAFVASVSSGGAAGIVTGEAGIGKTALLHRLTRRSEAPVRWLRGIEAEAVLPFAASADLLTPLRPYFSAVPPSQQRALEVALALADGAPPGALAICAGALGVLAAAGDETPLLVFVDDFQWIDAESRQLLLFVAHRLTTERWVFSSPCGRAPARNP